MSTKIFAAYLPQYHETADNNLFWGKGFTDWDSVKNAKPLFPGHEQPQIPYNEDYYDLSNAEAISNQAKIAKKYGVDGFNIYHYWFKNGKQELQTPAELLYKHKEIDIQYFFSWDNISWRRTWSNVVGNDWAPQKDSNEANTNQGSLVELDYGTEEDWEVHFKYLLPFFKDIRYLKVNDEPVFAFMTSIESDIIIKMVKYWRKLALDNGLKGLYIMSNKSLFINKMRFDALFEYEPVASSWGRRKRIEALLNKNNQKSDIIRYRYSYDTVWKRIINKTKRCKKNFIPSCFVRYDDTPRRGQKGSIILGATPEKFGTYFKMFYRISCKKKKPFVLITAWNEWSEGAFLEPDNNYHFQYLERLNEAIGH